MLQNHRPGPRFPPRPPCSASVGSDAAHTRSVPHVSRKTHSTPVAPPRPHVCRETLKTAPATPRSAIGVLRRADPLLAREALT
ncbi:hypothetical protein GCM10023405_15100 [Streptomonospora salina]